MKTILYFRTLAVGIKALFTRENVKQMLIGSMIGQAIGWAFVVGLFLTGCSKEPMTFSDMRPPPDEAPVCNVPAELTTELETLVQKEDALQAELDALTALIQATNNDKKIARLQEEHESVLLRLITVKLDIDEVYHQIQSYGCE